MFSLVSCRSDTFRRREPRSTNNQIMPQLLDATCTQENHQKTKEIPRVPRHNFLYSCSSCLQSCEFKALMAGVCALIDKDPLPHSGAQSVSRWLLWSSMGGSYKIQRLACVNFASDVGHRPPLCPHPVLKKFVIVGCTFELREIYVAIDRIDGEGRSWSPKKTQLP